MEEKIENRGEKVRQLLFSVLLRPPFKSLNEGQCCQQSALGWAEVKGILWFLSPSWTGIDDHPFAHKLLLSFGVAAGLTNCLPSSFLIIHNPSLSCAC